MVSVIIPYNIDRGYLKEAIDSVKNQIYGDWELITEKGVGCSLGQNVNNALLGARGKYVKILAEDDLLTPSSLSVLVKGIKGYDWVYSNAENFGARGWEEYSDDKTTTLQEMLKGNKIHGGTTLYRKSMLIEVGGYDATLRTGEEYDLHLKLLKAGYRHAHIPGIVYRYRIHKGNKSATTESFERITRHEYIKQIRQRYES